MATQTLLDGVTENGDGNSFEHSGPCTVWISGNLDRGRVVILGAAEDVEAEFTPAATVDVPRPVGLNGIGTHFLKARLVDAGPLANVTVKTTQ